MKIIVGVRRKIFRDRFDLAVSLLTFVNAAELLDENILGGLVVR